MLQASKDLNDKTSPRFKAEGLLRLKKAGKLREKKERKDRRRRDKVAADLSHGMEAAFETLWKMIECQNINCIVVYCLLFTSVKFKHKYGTHDVNLTKSMCMKFV